MKRQIPYLIMMQKFVSKPQKIAANVFFGTLSVIITSCKQAPVTKVSLSSAPSVSMVQTKRNFWPLAKMV